MPNPPEIEPFLKVDGARITEPVAVAKNRYDLSFVEAARKAYNGTHFQCGGDHAVYYCMHLPEYAFSAEAAPNMEYKPLERAIDPAVGKVKTMTSKGEMTLDDYIVDDHFRSQAIIMVHKGKVVYEKYPGMPPANRHLTASTGKVMTGTIFALLTKEGKIDLSKPCSEYVPELKGSAWDDVTIGNCANMCTGLNNEETLTSILVPTELAARFINSCAGSVDPIHKKIVDWSVIAKEAPTIPGENQGDVMRYSSVNTNVLTRAIEYVEDKPFARVFEERLWSKVYARRSIIFNLSQNGLALCTGFNSVLCEDYARFGLMYTPSWDKVMSERVIDDEVLDVIYSNVDKKRYEKSVKLPTSAADFNDPAMGNALQWDYIWDDGAISKSGNLNQMIYVDPKRDFVSVHFSSCPFVDGYGEFKAGAFQRAVAKFLNGEKCETVIAPTSGGNFI